MPCSKSVNAFVKSTCELDFFPPKFDFLNELVFLAFVNEVLLCTDELVFVLLLVLLLLLLLLLFDDLLLEDDEFGFFLRRHSRLQAVHVRPAYPRLRIILKHSRI